MNQRNPVSDAIELEKRVDRVAFSVFLGVASVGVSFGESSVFGHLGDARGGGHHVRDQLLVGTSRFEPGELDGERVQIASQSGASQGARFHHYRAAAAKRIQDAIARARQLLHQAPRSQWMEPRGIAVKAMDVGHDLLFVSVDLQGRLEDAPFFVAASREVYLTAHVAESTAFAARRVFVFQLHFTGLVAGSVGHGGGGGPCAANRVVLFTFGSHLDGSVSRASRRTARKKRFCRGTGGSKAQLGERWLRSRGTPASLAGKEGHRDGPALRAVRDSTVPPTEHTLNDVQCLASPLAVWPLVWTRCAGPPCLPGNPVHTARGDGLVEVRPADGKAGRAICWGDAGGRAGAVVAVHADQSGRGPAPKSSRTTRLHAQLVFTHNSSSRTSRSNERPRLPTRRAIGAPGPHCRLYRTRSHNDTN